MPRGGFKLNGDISSKFKQIETIIPRIMSHMSTKTYGIIPASIVSSYTKMAQYGEPLFNSVMFAGKVKKVIFKIAMFEGKDAKPSYNIKITSAGKENRFSVETKKLSHIMEIDLDINDGDVLTITQENPDIILHDVYLSALVSLAKGYDEVREFVTEQLLESIENEGI